MVDSVKVNSPNQGHTGKVLATLATVTGIPQVNTDNI